MKKNPRRYSDFALLIFIITIYISLLFTLLPMKRLKNNKAYKKAGFSGIPNHYNL